MNSQIVTFMSLMLWMNKLSSKQTTSRPRFIKTAWTFDTVSSKVFDWSTYITCPMIRDHHIYEHIVNKQKHCQLKGKLIQKYLFLKLCWTKRKEAGPHLHKLECLIPSISKWGRWPLLSRPIIIILLSWDIVKGPRLCKFLPFINTVLHELCEIRIVPSPPPNPP